MIMKITILAITWIVSIVISRTSLRIADSALFTHSITMRAPSSITNQLTTMSTTNCLHAMRTLIITNMAILSITPTTTSMRAIMSLRHPIMILILKLTLTLIMKNTCGNMGIKTKNIDVFNIKKAKSTPAKRRRGVRSSVPESSASMVLMNRVIRRAQRVCFQSK